MRPDANVIVAGGQRLYAPTPEELAEIAEVRRPVPATRSSCSAPVRPGIGAA